MRQTKLFTKTRKEAPKDEVSKNAQLLIRAGYVHKEMAGVYSYLPLGLRVMKKIENIIREEMNAIGGQEVEMTTLQTKGLWEKAGKWDDKKVDAWFKTALKNGTELGLAWSHEEALAEIVRNHVQSYKELPQYIYQFQTKFRNELRAKSGIMRGREFLMKDMYSFNKTMDGMERFYEDSKKAYKQVFDRTGIGDVTYITESDGAPFSDWSHEFQTLSEAGEDTIYLDEKTGIAINKEVYTDEKIEKLGLNKKDLVEKKSIEVGNIFPIGDKVAKQLNFTYTDENGSEQPIIMGSYGIGLGRLMGTVVEVLSDENGIVWPESIAPFRVHLVVLGEEGKGAHTEAELLYTHLEDKGVEVLYDDRDVSAGEKFADSDLIGVPTRVVISEKTLAAGKLEVKDRATGGVTMMGKDEFHAMMHG